MRERADVWWGVKVERSRARFSWAPKPGQPQDLMLLQEAAPVVFTVTSRHLACWFLSTEWTENDFKPKPSQPQYLCVSPKHTVSFPFDDKGLISRLQFNKGTALTWGGADPSIAGKLGRRLTVSAPSPFSAQSTLKVSLKNCMVTLAISRPPRAPGSGAGGQQQPEITNCPPLT